MLQIPRRTRNDFNTRIRNTAATLVLIDAIRLLADATEPGDVRDAQIGIRSLCVILSQRIAETVDLLEECGQAFDEHGSAAMSAERIAHNRNEPA